MKKAEAIDEAALRGMSNELLAKHRRNAQNNANASQRVTASWQQRVARLDREIRRRAAGA